ncbi:MAG: helix-turn-helix domain-containing protein [Planctomycetes bacterium]|nr:helix-turn-helix domain-containing protein [Planctomycetota bacterium]
MAKMFYTAKEAAQRLGKTEADLKELVKKGQLREFRDAGAVNFKVEEIDTLATKLGADSSPGASASGAILLEPAEDSGISLSGTGSDVLKLDEVDASDTATGMRTTKKAKEGTAVPSVGINVFDDDELDEVVDPLAQTAVTDIGGLGSEGVGSGSGILDLTRESDDTSLGAELLEEIYTGDEAGAGGAPAGGVQMGEATRAGLDQAIPEDAEEAEAEDEAVAAKSAGFAAVTAPTGGAPTRAVVTRVVEFAPDALSTCLTAAMVVAVAVMWLAGLSAAGLVRGVVPSLIGTLYQNLAMFAGGALLVAGIAAGVAYFLAKRSG